MTLRYTLVSDGDESNIVVFAPGRAPLCAHSSHPRFAEIVSGAAANDPAIVEMFDLGEYAAKFFNRLSDRVSYAAGSLYLDGEPVANALTAQVLRFIETGSEDWRPLVNFFENVQSNPEPHSREMLYSWLDSEAFTITADGLIVGYKGVQRDSRGDLYSVNRGRAIVNGEVHSGAIPNPLGAIVEMPRSEVNHDPAQGCSTGLHVGTYAYASGWARGALLEVHVHPRDVVSVPTDCGAQKMRTCRYYVAKLIDAKIDDAAIDASTAPRSFFRRAVDAIRWGDSEV